MHFEQVPLKSIWKSVEESRLKKAPEKELQDPPERAAGALTATADRKVVRPSSQHSGGGEPDVGWQVRLRPRDSGAFPELWQRTKR
jgi:hypothetical protein